MGEVDMVVGTAVNWIDSCRQSYIRGTLSFSFCETVNEGVVVVELFSQFLPRVHVGFRLFTLMWRLISPSLLLSSWMSTLSAPFFTPSVVQLSRHFAQHTHTKTPFLLSLSVYCIELPMSFLSPTTQSYPFQLYSIPLNCIAYVSSLLSCPILPSLLLPL